MRKLWLLAAFAAIGCTYTGTASAAEFDYYQSTGVRQVSHLGCGDCGCAPEPTCCEPEPTCCAPEIDSCGCGDIGCTDGSCCGGCTSSCCGCEIDLFGDCCLGDPWTLFGENCHGIEVGGWLQSGYSTGGTTFIFNTYPDQVQINQAWVYAEKVADGSCGIGFGGRVDFVYGTDGPNTQAFGNPDGVWDYDAGDGPEDYGWAIPQLYGEVAYGDLSVKLGHFYTLVGYEVVTAPDNFFYSHSLTLNFAEPFTHTGALASYAVNDCVTAYAGWTYGWDTGFDEGDPDGSSFLGGVSVSLSDDLSVTYITTWGDLGGVGEGYSHSIVADYTVRDDLNYVFQSDYLDTDFNTRYGVNQYLFYTVSDCVALGVRGEWFRFDEGLNDNTDTYEITYGVNYKPHANVIIRPEMRHQWAKGDSSGGFDGDIFGIDAILTF